MINDDVIRIVIDVIDLLIKIYQDRKITYHDFLKNTNLKVKFLESCLNIVNETEKNEIGRILSKYRGLVCNDSSSPCNTHLLEDQFPY